MAAFKTFLCLLISSFIVGRPSTASVCTQDSTTTYSCSTNDLICGRKIPGDHSCDLPIDIVPEITHKSCGLPSNGGTIKFELGDGKTTCKDGGGTKYCGHNRKYLPRHFLVVGDDGRPNGYRLEPEFSVMDPGSKLNAQHRAERIKFRYGGNLTFAVDETTGTCNRNLEVLVMPSSGYWGGPSYCRE